MKTKTYDLVLVIAAAGLLSGASPLGAHEGPPRDPATPTCESYDLDVRGDIALLAQDARPLTFSADGGAQLPAIEVGQHYAAKLHPQGEVKFDIEPSRVMLADGAYAGHARFSVPVSGHYRIALSSESWVDVLAGGDYLETEAFAGRVECKPLRKLVDYMLEADESYVLMLSGGSEDVMGTAIRLVE